MTEWNRLALEKADNDVLRRRLELCKAENLRLNARVLDLRTALFNANNRIADLEWELSCLRDERDAIASELHDCRQEHAQ